MTQQDDAALVVRALENFKLGTMGVAQLEDALAAARRLQQAQGAQEAVAFGVRVKSDGSWGRLIAPVGYLMFDQNLADLKADPWIDKGLSEIAPLYAAPAPVTETAAQDADGRIPPAAEKGAEDRFIPQAAKAPDGWVFGDEK